MVNYQLDCCGMTCPMPIYMLAKKMKELQEEECLELSADDPGFKADLEAWVLATKNTLISLKLEGKVYHAVIQKSKK